MKNTQLSTGLKRKINKISLFFLAVFLSCLVGAQGNVAKADAEFAGGDGSAGNPYQIATPQQLANINNRVGSDANIHYKLTADIDLNVSPYNTSTGWTPLGNNTSPFLGSLDGNGKTISNLYIYRATGTYLGLFGAIGSGALLDNFTLSGVTVTVYNNIDSFSYIGGLVGNVKGGATVLRVNVNSGSIGGGWLYGGGITGYNSGIIRNSFSNLTVSAGYYAGGIVGQNDGTISKCYSTGTTTADAAYAGGITAWNNGGTVKNSFSTSHVTASPSGGLVGINNGTITNSYSTGVATGDWNVGGLVGRQDGGVVTNSYWDSETSATTTSATGTPKTTAEMKDQATFAGWDFTNNWSITSGNYPQLNMALQAPEAPNDLTLDGINESYISVYWYTPASDLPIAYYDLEYRLDGQGDWISATTTETNYNLSISGSHNYDFRVRAYNSLGYSQYSNTLTIAPPDAPSNFQVSEGSGPLLVNLNWTAPTSFGGGNANSYLITYKKSSDSWSNYANTTWADQIATSYSDLSYYNFAPGQSYDFKIQATNNSGAPSYQVLYSAPTYFNNYVFPPAQDHYITSCAQLQNLASNVAAANGIDGTVGFSNYDNYYLTKDIDCAAEGITNFTPITWGETYFFGTFNGQGHRISNLVINQSESYGVGLFLNLGDGAVVENLTLASGSVTGLDNVGAIAGYVDNGATINNVTSYLDVSGSMGEGNSEGYAVGGLIGDYESEITGLTLTNNKIFGTVSGNAEVGGLVGYVEDSPNNNYAFTMSGNTVNGKISALKDGDGNYYEGYSVGGLIGDYEWHLEDDNLTFNFTATNNTISASSSIEGYRNIGGLFGYVYFDDEYSGNTLNANFGPNNKVLASVTGNSNSGGLLGYLEYYDEDEAANSAMNIFQSYVTGNIGGQNDYFGGLIGYIDTYGYGENYQVNISDSYFNGHVSGNNNIGGLIGYAYDDSWNAETLAISRSYAAGSVIAGLNGGNTAGGLIGYNEMISGIRDSFAANTVDGNGEVDGYGNAGALIGSDDTTSYLNDYYDQSKNPTMECYPYSGELEGCNPVNSDGESPNYFFNNYTNAPFADNWLFSGNDKIWKTVAAGYPILRFAAPTTFWVNQTYNAENTNSGHSWGTDAFNNLTSLFGESGSLVIPEGESTTTPAHINVNADTYIEVPETSGVNTVLLPASTTITRSSEGETIDASLLSATDIPNSNLSGFASGQVVQGALQWGIPSVGLSFSQPITLSIFVGADLNGQTLNVYRSLSTTGGWTSDGIVAPGTCLVSSDGLCTFQTSKASYFSATKNVPAPSVGGGGGSGALVIVTPTQLPVYQKLDFTINNNEKLTSASTLNISLNADPKTVSGYVISLDNKFPAASIIKYAPQATLALPAKSGVYTVYLKYYSTSGKQSEVISHSIEYQAVKTSADNSVLTSSGSSKFIFKKDLKLNQVSPDAKELQKYLNANGFLIAKTGAGSLGKETSKFGLGTKAALIKFQKAHGIKPASGNFGSLTRKVVNGK